MSHDGSRGIRRVATVALMGGLITFAATPAMAATAAGPAPDGTRVTGDGHPWTGSSSADSIQWEGIARPDGHSWGDGHAVADGNPWHGIVRPAGNAWIGGTSWGGSVGAADDGNPWHNLLAPDGHGWIEGEPTSDGGHL